MKMNGGYTSYWKGKKMSDEARKKMSEAKKGKKRGHYKKKILC